MRESFRYQLFRAKRRDGKLYPKWRIKYFQGKRYLFSEVGYTDKGRTEERAKERTRELEHKAHLVEVGVPVVQRRPILELVDRWLGELARSGGKQGMPAAAQHVKSARVKVTWWIKALHLESPAEVRRDDVIARASGLKCSVATQEIYIQHLKTFLGWCFRNGYLAANPLAAHKKAAATPTFRRRALTVDEALRLLAVASDRRAMVYKTALLTGMRRAELDSLRVGSVDWKAGKIALEARHAKNRKAADFYLPDAFLVELYAFCAGRRLDDRLFLTPVSPSKSAQTMHRDLGKAGVPVETAEGRIDFHSLRVTFLTWVNELGEDVKTVQDLARHADPRLTFGVYTKAREDRLRAVVTRAGARLLEPNRDIPRLGVGRAGVTQAAGAAGTLDFIGSEAVGQAARCAAR